MAALNHSDIKKEERGSVEGRMEINGVQLHYETRGKGSHALVCIPAALATAQSAFGPQLEYFGREGSDFRIVSFDPRGYGNSRPANRSEEGSKSNVVVAEDAHTLMQALSLSKYSVLGWCDGGTAALLLAAMYPESVQNLVVWGARAYITKEDTVPFEELKDINNWSPQYRDPMLKLYGEAYFRELNSKLYANIDAILSKAQGDICKKDLPKIVCKTLILHGAKDPLVRSIHPEYIREHVIGSRLEVMKDGKHYLHLQYHQKFNEIVENFLKAQN